MRFVDFLIFLLSSLCSARHYKCGLYCYWIASTLIHNHFDFVCLLSSSILSLVFQQLIFHGMCLHMPYLIYVFVCLFGCLLADGHLKCSRITRWIVIIINTFKPFLWTSFERYSLMLDAYYKTRFVSLHVHSLIDGRVRWFPSLVN